MKKIALLLRSLFSVCRHSGHMLTAINNSVKQSICFVLLFGICMTGFAQEADLYRKAGHKSELKTISISPDNKYFISFQYSQ